jgi:type IV pilus assembly protein PilA
LVLQAEINSFRLVIDILRKGVPFMNKKGFTLVELMVVVAIVAILAAVALPMYSTFRQKSRVSTCLKSLSGAQTALQAYFDDNQTFTSIDSGGIPSDGGAITDTASARIGAGLAEVPNVAWGFGSSTSSAIALTWAFSSGCPAAVCDGTWTLTCEATNDKCTPTAVIGDGSLGLNF